MTHNKNLSYIPQVISTNIHTDKITCKNFLNKNKLLSMITGLPVKLAFIQKNIEARLGFYIFLILEHLKII